MIQDYPALRTPCIKSLSKVHYQLFNVFSKVKCLTTSSYLVELVSQLESDGLVQLIFNQNPDLCEKFPDNCYANDPPCLKFLQLTKFDPSIFKFKSFSLDDKLHSGESYCQITSNYVICLLDYNDFAAPIQFDLQHIRNMERIGSQVQFNLVKSAKKALINVDIPQNSRVIINLISDNASLKFVSRHNQVAGNIDVVSTPQRKISVVQNFIALSAGYDEVEGYEEDQDNILKRDDDRTIEREQFQDGREEFSNSGQIEETESLFGSPVNTTKDTSVSKKFGRAVSAIVAESNEKGSNPPKIQPSMDFQNSNYDKSENFEQVPDSLDKAFENFHNPPVDRGPSEVVIESVPEQIDPIDPPKKEPSPKQKDDIWDFESDPDLTLNNPQATSTVNKKYKSKAMKCLTSLMNSTEKKPKAGKNEQKVKKEVKNKVNAKLEDFKNNVTEKDISSSIDFTQQNAGSFMPLTSPLESAHQRARTRGFSKALENEDEHVSSLLGNSETKPGPKIKKKPGPKPKKRPIDEDSGSEYVESQSRKKPRQTRAAVAISKGEAKPTPRITRGKKKQTEQEERKDEDEDEVEAGAATFKQKSVEPKIKINEAKARPLLKPSKLEPSNEVVDKENIEPKVNKTNAKCSNAKEAPPAKGKNAKDLPKTKVIGAKDSIVQMPSVTSTTINKSESSKSIGNLGRNQAILESTRLIDPKEKENVKEPTKTTHTKPAALDAEQHLPIMSPAGFSAPIAADTILSEAYTNTLQRQIFESITMFSNQLVNKIHIINDEINKKVMTDLTTKYESLFNELRESFQSDVDEMCGFITDVKGLLNLPEQELIDYIKQKKCGTIATSRS